MSKKYSKETAQVVDHLNQQLQVMNTTEQWLFKSSLEFAIDTFTNCMLIGLLDLDKAKILMKHCQKIVCKYRRHIAEHGKKGKAKDE